MLRASCLNGPVSAAYSAWRMTIILLAACGTIRSFVLAELGSCRCGGLCVPQAVRASTVAITAVLSSGCGMVRLVFPMSIECPFMSGLLFGQAGQPTGFLPFQLLKGLFNSVSMVSYAAASVMPLYSPSNRSFQISRQRWRTEVAFVPSSQSSAQRCNVSSDQKFRP